MALALPATVASSASAHSFHIAPSTPTSLLLDSGPESGLGIGLECFPQITGTMADGAESLTLVPGFAKCPAANKSNGCVFVLDGTTGESEEDEQFHLDCPGEAKLELAYWECTMKIGDQEVNGELFYAINEGELEVGVYVKLSVASKSGTWCLVYPDEVEVDGTISLSGFEDLEGKPGWQRGIALE